MALGIPVVATSKGVEGLEAQMGDQLLIADSPDIFAESVIKLLQGKGLHQGLVANAQQLMREKYDWAGIMPAFLDLLKKIPKNN
jgi:glycosyltransferase involved in cell wall biosynthesis